MPRTALALGLALALSACADDSPRLIIELVPNPEVNTRADVTAQVNSLEVTLDAEGGFLGLEAGEGDSWGPYEVTDVDEDQVLELVLAREGGPAALDPFALAQGSQAGRMLAVTVRGFSDDNRQLTALGSAAASFGEAEDLLLELPFNLTPDYRPLRVLSMSPAQGAQNIEPPVETVTLQLSGHVQESAFEAGPVVLREVNRDCRLQPTLRVSYVETGLGRTTTVYLGGGPLYGGTYEVSIAAGALCTRRGQCLDQHLGVEGPQPFVGRFSIRGIPQELDCAATETPEVPMSASACPELPCEAGFACVEGSCVLEVGPESLPEGPEWEPPDLECDPTLCTPPEFLCGDLGACQPDCRLFGACPDPTERCDPASGLCS